jgi:hypothetical protein
MISWLPGLIFGILCIAAGMLTLLLPESVNRPLPESAEEIIQWHRELQFCPCTRQKNANRENEDSDVEMVHLSV